MPARLQFAELRRRERPAVRSAREADPWGVAAAIV